jgi:hypothetical protein
VEPSDILEKMNHKQAGLKTTGLEEESSSSEKSQTLRDWRENVANLSPSDAGDLTVEDLRQLLDEIQETVDEAERSQDAVRQASQMRVQAQKAADGEGGELGADGSTTTIGFGKPTLSGEVPPVATTTQATAQAKPMMVIKKKKKKRDEDEDSKPAAVESKRAKTE